MTRLITALILGAGLLLQAVPVFAQETFGESCREEFICLCDGNLYPEIQEQISGLTDVQAGSQACAQACANFGASGTWELFCEEVSKNQGNIPTPAESAEAKEEYQVPILAVPIPGLVFTPAQEINGEITSNYLGQYVQALYSLIIVIAAIGTVLTIMIAGLRWMVARGDAGAVSDAKESIGKAFVAMFILIGVVSIVNLVDPSLTRIEGLRLPIVERIEIAYSDGEEGAITGGEANNCTEAVAKAKSESTCAMSELIGSPTGSPFSCNYHFRDDGYDYTKIKALDYPASFGQPIYAPFEGTVTYVQGTGGDRCGNRIRLNGSGGGITMCHVKNFLDSSGRPIRSGTTVVKGAVIGHVGGACCAGQSPPSSWSQSDKCTVSGTPCSDPNKNESCQCQPFAQSGNTSGPHVHITYTGSGHFLSCLE